MSTVMPHTSWNVGRPLMMKSLHAPKIIDWVGNIFQSGASNARLVSIRNKLSNETSHEK